MRELFNTFFQNVYLKNIFVFLAQYLVTQKLDSFQEQLSDSDAHTLLAKQLLECLKEALLCVCKRYQWEYDDMAIEETFLTEESPWANIKTIDNLKRILVQAVGAYDEGIISDSVVDFWLESFEQSVACHQELYNYIHEKRSNASLSRNTLQAFDKTNRDVNHDYPFRYDSGSTALLGRSDELLRLKAFIECSANILWWAIVGTGGIGKSRLAYEFAKSIDSDKWVAKTFNRYSELTISTLNKEYDSTNYNLLIIIDNDAYDFTEIAKWIFNISINNYDRKIRVLILQRLSSAVNLEYGMQWMNTLLGHNEVVFNTFYSEDKSNQLLELQTLRDHELIEIAESFIVKMNYNGKFGDFDDERKNTVISKLYEIDPINRRPLYLLFVTDAVVHNQDIRNYNQEMIMNDVFLRERGRLRLQIEEAFGVDYSHNNLLYDAIEMEIACATVSDAANMKIRVESCSDLSGLSKERFIAVCEQFGLCQNGNFVPVEPDLLGEYFVMRYLDRFSAVLGEKSFWQRFFRDYYRLLNTTYRKGLLNILVFAFAPISEFYYKGLFEAFVVCNDMDERKYIMNLLSKFRRIWEDEEWKKEYSQVSLLLKNCYIEESLYNTNKSMFEVTVGINIDEMLYYMDLVINGVLNIEEIPKLHEYEADATFFANSAKIIYANLKYNYLDKYLNGEIEYDEKPIIDCLNTLEKEYVNHIHQIQELDLPRKKSEYPYYYALSMKECLCFFCDYPEISREWLWGFIKKILIRLKEMHEHVDDKYVTEVYISVLMIQYEHEKCSDNEKAEIFTKLLALKTKYGSYSESIKRKFSVFFENNRNIIIFDK